MSHHLVGAAEVARMLGVSRQRVNDIVRSSTDFPEPEAELSAGRIWLREEVEKWMRAHGYGRDNTTVSDIDGIAVITPQQFQDATKIADAFVAPKSVLVDLRSTDSMLHRRVVDWSASLAYSHKGAMDRLVDKAYLLVPGGHYVDTAHRSKLTRYLLGNEEAESVSPEGVAAVIARYFEETFDLAIGGATASEIASTVLPQKAVAFQVNGVNLLSGNPATITANVDELKHYIAEHTNEL